jgi:hypothetical protein
MAENGFSPDMVLKSRKPVENDKRITTAIPYRSNLFLDIVAKCTGNPKVTLYQHIWRAGLEAVFGITEEELDECPIAAPTVSQMKGVRKLKDITDVICGE